MTANPEDDRTGQVWEASYQNISSLYLVLGAHPKLPSSWRILSLEDGSQDTVPSNCLETGWESVVRWERIA